LSEDGKPILVDHERPVRELLKGVMRKNPGLSKSKLFKRFAAALEALPETEKLVIEKAILEYYFRTNSPSGRN
jgi:hypothetical protein